MTLTRKADGSLRGCIGEILPMRPLVEAVTARAADSALEDPRFEPVTPDELPGLRVEVSALQLLDARVDCTTHRKELRLRELLFREG